jgi:hypothetical protein
LYIPFFVSEPPTPDACRTIVSLGAFMGALLARAGGDADATLAPATRFARVMTSSTSLLGESSPP